MPHTRLMAVHIRVAVPIPLHATEAATPGCSLSIGIATIGTPKPSDSRAMVRSAWVMVRAARWNRNSCCKKSTTLGALVKRCRPRLYRQTLRSPANKAGQVYLLVSEFFVNQALFFACKVRRNHVANRSCSKKFRKL